MHGNKALAEESILTCLSLSNKFGYPTIAFDPSGYGLSGGTPTMRSIESDANAMLIYILRKYPSVNFSNVYIYGHGIGCSYALYFARSYVFGGIYLRGAFNRMTDAIDAHKGLISVVITDQLIKSLTFVHNEQLLSMFNERSKNTPIFVYHNESDEVVPISSGKSLYNGLQLAGFKSVVFKSFAGNHEDLSDLF
jgi:predicted esterase